MLHIFFFLPANNTTLRSGADNFTNCIILKYLYTYLDKKKATFCYNRLQASLFDLLSIFV